MNIILTDTTIRCRDMTQQEFDTLRNMGIFVYDRRTRSMCTEATTDSIPKIYHAMKYTSRELVDLYKKLKKTEDAVKNEREKETPSDYGSYYTKRPLYAHQRRAVNMALLVFGYDPETGKFQ